MSSKLTIVDDDGTEEMVEEPVSEYGFSYADYIRWNFKERIELLKGQIVKMSPAPTILHQKISFNLEAIRARFFQNGPCVMLHAPVDVKLKGGNNLAKHLDDSQIRTVVRPDIIVVCDPGKLRGDQEVNGTPELVIEIISPGDTTKELRFKRHLYEENEVKEYWEIDSARKWVEIYTVNSKNTYDEAIVDSDTEAISKLFPTLRIMLSEIFITK